VAASQPDHPYLGMRKPSHLEPCRAAIAADPAFAQYLAATNGMIVAQEDPIVRRVSFETLATG
jgi:hypothetical protein